MKNILIAISLIISASSFAQSKIGHVNSQILLDTLESRKQAIKELDAYKLEGMKELQEMNKAFEAAYVIFQQKEKDLSPVLLKMEQEKMGRKQQELEARQQELEKGLQIYNDELNKPILDRITKAIEIVADRKKINYIIDESATLYSKGGIDCTAEVMIELLRLDAEAIKNK
ncbi:MAG: OmpH family outer membrane protein [Flavobacteriia bacterium]|nr:OmpH family outer membrane protein [Flavobacteriia bacterium]